MALTACIGLIVIPALCILRALQDCPVQLLLSPGNSLHRGSTRLIALTTLFSD
jgi:hypothetical protein